MGWAKLRDAVTFFTAILVRRGSELALVNVLMATGALRLRNAKRGVLTLWGMTRVAFHFGMPAFQWIAAGSMLFNPKCRWLEPAHSVTNGAICTFGGRHELAAVIVGMAIHAFGKCNRRLEITFVVAVAASYGAVFSEERISCLGMIEALKLGHASPTRCVVARLAGAFEAASVRIPVAIITARE